MVNTNQITNYESKATLYSNSQLEGNDGVRTYVPYHPASHLGPRLVIGGGSISITTLLMIIGIILWAVGAAQGNLSTALAGKICFLVGVIPLAVTTVLLSCFGRQAV